MVQHPGCGWCLQDETLIAVALTVGGNDTCPGRPSGSGRSVRD